MARQARQKSESGIYHVMMRGINKQAIFHDEEDYVRFIKVIKKAKQASQFELYAYCLMPNHIHMLIRETEEPLSKIIKRIGCSYVYWYNIKYTRVGHLFQDRYRSEPVETDEYFLAALRYIHQNPVKAEIVQQCSNYKYSSFNKYLTSDDLINKDYTFSIISENLFKTFHQQDEKKEFIDITDVQKRVSDEMALKIYNELTNYCEHNAFKKMDKSERNKMISQMKKRGLTGRQIIEITGLSRSLIESVK